VFAENFQRYVHQEHNRRRRDDRVCVILSLLLVGVMLAFGSDVQFTAITGSAFLVTSMTFSTVRFCVSYRELPKPSQRRVNRGQGILYRPVSRRAALVTVSVAAVAAAVVLEVPEVGAAIVDRRLQKLVEPGPLDQKAMLGVAAAFDEAARYKLKLSLESARIGARTATKSTLDIPPPPDMQGKPFASSTEAKGATWEFMPIATNTGPDNYETIGVARLPEFAEMLHVGEPPPVALYGPAYLVVKGLDATLDGFRLKHVVFQNMSLAYHGGPLTLDEVYFINCSFQFDPTVESWSLISSVIKGGWVSFFYVPEQ
jgi:hypothetical protein